MKKKNTYTLIGLMSGTSLDGLDIALCEFTKKNNWQYNIIEAKTIAYNKALKQKLQNAHVFSAQDFWQLHTEFGKFSGQAINKFLKGKKQNVDAIASHGHTVFHQPQNGFTCQLGDGASIAAITGITTICDFRSTDVALGGQGAPLVPIGDELLFNNYNSCLNIGGIANISFNQKGKRMAFDICAANMLFNYLANKLNLPYDKGGKLAARGKVNDSLLKKLNAHSFYKEIKSKSLGREWVDEKNISVIEKSIIPIKDKMATALEHSAFQIATVLNKCNLKNVLITGGGAYNTFLLERIRHYTNCKIIVPNDKTVQFKEALLFAFLGVLRLREEINCLKKVTGALSDSCGGALYRFADKKRGL